MPSHDYTFPFCPLSLSLSLDLDFWFMVFTAIDALKQYVRTINIFSSRPAPRSAMMYEYLESSSSE